MFENIIEFKANILFIEENKHNLPVPIKTNIPRWFKELNHSVHLQTIKGCMPFLDTLTSGYLLKMPVEYHVEHNVEHEGEMKTGMRSGVKKWPEDLSNIINLNYDSDNQTHPIIQLGKCPFIEKNKNLPFHKILNPWSIKTPPGYSCLFLPPMNNTDDRFSIIPGIVDTDTFPGEINFPVIWNGDKYPNLKTTIELGTPYVQVIPFKRDSWKMKITELSTKKRRKNIFNQFKNVLYNYKKNFWSKKLWK
tara:strand:- start:86 stop:832 length:747 start_codon:yes stop_codon:yes gene_type:complete